MNIKFKSFVMGLLLMCQTGHLLAKDIQTFVDPVDQMTELVLTDEECPRASALKQNYYWMYKVRGVPTGCYGDNGKEGADGVWFYIVFIDGSYRKGRYSFQQISDAIQVRDARLSNAYLSKNPFTYPVVPAAPSGGYSSPPPTNLTPGLTGGNSGGVNCTPNGSGGFYCR